LVKKLRRKGIGRLEEANRYLEEKYGEEQGEDMRVGRWEAGDSLPRAEAEVERERGAPGGR